MLLDIEDSEASKSFLSYFFVKLSFRRDCNRQVLALVVCRQNDGILVLVAIDANRGDKRGRGIREIEAEKCWTLLWRTAEFQYPQYQQIRTYEISYAEYWTFCQRGDTFTEADSG